ncbi:MAG TPA: hypothetical protein VFS76_09340 [Pyrinomonadaceae bacterium]|nr:hypothetical protein [Pyrinomonadaceae bacterium]
MTNTAVCWWLLLLRALESRVYEPRSNNAPVTANDLEMSFVREMNGKLTDGIAARP